MKILTALAAACLFGTFAAAQAPVQPAPVAQSVGPAPGQADVGPDYILGPGDMIQVFVWRSPELSVTVPVRPDGKVTTPLVDDMVATGRTTSELARLIETRLSEYIRSPQVSVIVTDAQSMSSKVTVIGQVGAPQSVPYRQGMTVLDVVLVAGGLSEFAGGNKAKLQRTGANGKQTTIGVKLNDLIKKGRMKENIAVLPGDVLIVPESRF